MLPETEGPRTRALLEVVLVDADTDLARAICVVSFSPEFTRALHGAIRAQAAAPWIGQAAYDAALTEVYRRYPTGGDLLQRAVARTLGGE